MLIRATYRGKLDYLYVSGFKFVRNVTRDANLPTAGVNYIRNAVLEGHFTIEQDYEGGFVTPEQQQAAIDNVLTEARDYTDTVVSEKISEAIETGSFAKTNINNNFSAAQTVNGTLTINGDIVQNGESYITHAEEVYTKNDLIKTREGAVGGLGANEFTGIEAEKYDGENNGIFGFDASGTARVGDVGDEQPLLTRMEDSELSDGQVLVWDDTNKRAIGSEEFVKKPSYSETLPETLVADTEYYLGESTALTFSFPLTGELGQYCFIKFVSGATATALTISGTNYVGSVPVPVAGKTYELVATWNGNAWVCSYRGY